MQITEQIIERIARRVFNTMFSPALRQSNVVMGGSGSSVSWADNAGHANSADAASSASSVPWSGVSSKPHIPSVSGSASGSTLTITIDGTAYSLTDTNTWRPVVDNLTSTDTNKSLSANQGKVLNDKFANYLPLAGGTMTGVLTLKGNQYSGNYGMNANNSDIVGLNALQFADLSDDYTESILFPRTAVQGVVTYDTIRAADGTFYFGFASGSEFITMTGSMIKHERTDNSSVIFRAKNTKGSISLDCSTNRGVYDDTGGGWLIGTNGTNTFLMRGNVGIGTTSPSYKLDVNGVIYSNTGVYSAGYVTALSDARKKDVLGDVELSAEQIAEMPAVRFSWTDKTKPGIFIGTLAQPWQKLLPEAVRTMADGVLSFDYQSAAMVSVINLAREVAAIKSKLKRYGFK